MSDAANTQNRGEVPKRPSPLPDEREDCYDLGYQDGLKQGCPNCTCPDCRIARGEETP